jgi:hypothetical protein
MRLYPIGFAAILSACSSQLYEPAAPQGDAPTKQIIAENVSQIFAPSSHPTDVLVTTPRPFVEQGLFGWIVCVRARIVDMNGADAGFQTVAVFYQKREMSLRRRAEPKDKCEGFQRLDARS